MSSKTKREELTSIVKERDVDAFVAITRSWTGSELGDTLAEFNKSYLEELWDGVFGMCTQVLLDEKETEDAEYAQTMHRVLKAAADLSQATVKALLTQKCEGAANAVIQVPNSLKETVILLHGILPNLEESQVVLRNQMSRLFEDWWHHNLDGRLELVPNTLLYLLNRSTQTKSSQMDVSRVWAVRGMLDCLDLTNQDNGEVISLLQRCTHHPQYMTSKPGIKFLAFILTLNPILTENLHQSIKNIIFTTPISWHPKYGEVYLKSWQAANNQMRQKIEECCIQDLMFRAVHACRQGPHNASSALFRLLSHIHKQKTQKGVESMLTSLYGPILWRSLKVANSDVRLNAASLMFNAFPLQDHNLLREESDASLQRQFNLMNCLLSDPVVEIRVTAVLGVGRVLSMYWELIPVQVIQSLVTTLVQEMIYDATAPTVREAVLKVMYQLCDNHLCIPMLKKVLPELGNFIHDSSERVRVAMLDLLLKVKGLRAIKYWSIVPVEHVLARLETDSHFVSRRIMGLIASSFVPLDQPPSEQVERCLALISTNRGAARQFFLNLPKSLGVVDTTKYIIVLCRYALESSRIWTSKEVNSSHLQQQSGDGNEENNERGRQERNQGGLGGTKKGKSKIKKRRSRTSRRLNVDTAEEEDNSSAERGSEASQSDGDGDISFNMDLLSGLMEGVYIMYAAISSELRSTEHVAIKEGLSKKLCVTVRELIKFSHDPILEQALIGLAGQLPTRGLPLISQNLFNKLKQQCSSSQQQEVVGRVGDSEEGKLEELTCVVKALVLWGRAGELVELVGESLSDYLEKGLAATPSPKGAKLSPKAGKKKKKVAFEGTEKDVFIDADKALDILNIMITQAECRPILLNRHAHSLASLMEGLEDKVQQKLEQLFEASPVMPTECMGERNGKEKKKKKTAHIAHLLEMETSLCLSVFSLYVRLAVFLSLTPDEDTAVVIGDVDDNIDKNDNVSCDRGCTYLRKSLSWLCLRILPLMEESPSSSSSRSRSSSPKEERTNSQQVKLATELLGAVLKSCSGLLMIGVRDNEVTDRAAQICMQLLKPEHLILSNFLLEQVLVFTYQLTQIRLVDVHVDDLEPSAQENTDNQREAQLEGSSIYSSDLRPVLKYPLHFSLSVFQCVYLKIAAKATDDISDSSNASAPSNGKKKDAVSASTLIQSMGEILQALVSPSKKSSSVNFDEKVMEVVPRLVISDMERMSRQDLLEDEEGNVGKSSSELNHRVLTQVRKHPKTLRWFVDSCVLHLTSPKASIHSLHAIVCLACVLKSHSSDPVNPDLKQAVDECMGKITPDEMDPDDFSDLKRRVERKISTWTLDQSLDALGSQDSQ